MFEKSYSGKCRLIQVFSSIWQSKDWTITLVQSVLNKGGKDFFATIGGNRKVVVRYGILLGMLSMQSLGCNLRNYSVVVFVLSLDSFATAQTINTNI